MEIVEVSGFQGMVGRNVVGEDEQEEYMGFLGRWNDSVWY